MIASMLLGLISLAVPFGMLAALFLWARWLRKRTGAPARISTVAYVAILVDLGLIVLLPVAGSVYAAVHVSPDVTSVDSSQVEPSQKARALAEGISAAMNWTFFGWIAAFLLTAFFLLHATWRWHWSLRASSVPREPPYR